MATSNDANGARRPPRRVRRRKTDKRGRSGAPAKKGVPKSGPAACGFKTFVWLPEELLGSPAWRAMGINTRRLLDRILLEHLRQAGAANGELTAPYADLDAYGVTRDCIADAIDEAVALGLLRVRRGRRLGGRNDPHLYHLTWMGAWDENGELIDPTNDWTSITDETIHAFKAERRSRRGVKRGDPKN